MTDMLWEDPPEPQQRPTGRWADVVAELKAHPGKWAMIKDFGDKRPQAYNLKQSIRNGAIAAFRPPSDFEVVHRTKDGISKTYARYIGGQS